MGLTFRLKFFAVALALALIWSVLSLGGLLARPAWVGYHALFEARGPLPPSQDVVIVAIDEASMEGLATWPIPRSLYGQLVDGLAAAGASVIGLDVTFPQAQFATNDQAFAAALARHRDRVVLAANFQPVNTGSQAGEQLVLPYKPFREAAAVGIVNLDFDADGGIHRFRPLRRGVDPENLSALKTYEGFDYAIARRHLARPLPAWAEDADGAYLIDYQGPAGHFRTVSLIKVLEAVYANDTAFLSQFRGRVALLGATSLRLQDQYPTPFSAPVLGTGSATYMPGVEIHANVIATLLEGTPIRPVPAPVQALFLLGLGTLAGATLIRLRPWLGLLALAGGLVGVWGLAYALFAWGRIWLDPAAPWGLLATVYVGAVAAHFTRAERTRRFYRQTFERYVSPDIVAEVLANPGIAPRLGGERREVSVLFSDIRSFTTISEKLTPEEVVEFLNAYLSAMAEVILAHEGCIDKYIGDAILALWGNVKPLSPEEGACLAVSSALAMKRRVDELQSQWQARGFPHIAIGVGVNTGEAVVGNIGSPRKLEFGVIGDSINVASRLEGLTKDYGGALIISDRTRALIGERFNCTYLDTVKVKGREQPVPIYRVDGEADGAQSARSA